jgi:hypothetical protein
MAIGRLYQIFRTPSNVLAKLLLFAFLVAFVPITVYFTSVAYFFNGMLLDLAYNLLLSLIHLRQAPRPSLRSLQSSRQT